MENDVDKYRRKRRRRLEICIGGEEMRKWLRNDEKNQRKNLEF